MSAPPTVLLTATEDSADNLGAGLMRALRDRLGPDGVRFVGVGGARMAAEGLASAFPIGDLAILGLWDGIRALPRVNRRADEVAALAARERPDAAVLIDAWGFSLRVAARLRRQDRALPIVKYVGPQVFAARPGRAKKLARQVDLLLSTQSLDLPYYEGTGLPVRFVGNPVLTRSFVAADPARARAAVGAGEGDRILLILPGSRRNEIRRLMPVFGEAAAALVARRPDLKLALPVAPSVADLVRAELAKWSVPVALLEGSELKDDAFVAGTAALACSGTVTTELALAGCPMVVAYKADRLTYTLAQVLLIAPFITLFNIAAGREVAKELVQDKATGPALVAALEPLLDDPAARAAQAAAQTDAVAKMGRDLGDPSAKAAEAVLEMLRPRRELPQA